MSRAAIDENLGSIIEGRIAKARVDGSGVVIFFYRGEVPKKSNDSVGISKSH